MELRWPPGVLERPWRALEGSFTNQLSSSFLPFFGASPSFFSSPIRPPPPGYTLPVIQSTAVALQESPKLTSVWGLWEEVSLSIGPVGSAEAR